MHLNPVGDVVAYDGVGEVVLLPHLWDFDLLTVGKFIVLRASGNDLGDGKSGDGNSGMTAVLGFEHPVTGEHLQFEQPWPDDLANLHRELTKM